MNPYKILNIKPTKDKMAIRRAFVSETKKHHPDVGGDQEHFARIQAAYDVLISGSWGSNPLETEVKLDLLEFWTGCVATAIFTDELGQIYAIEFHVPQYAYPGQTFEFFDEQSTKRFVRVKLLELTTNKWRRLDSHIIIKHTINSIEAITGIDLKIENFDSIEHKISIPPQTTANRLIYNIPGSGFYEKSCRTRGDLTIIIEVKKGN